MKKITVLTCLAMTSGMAAAQIAYPQAEKQNVSDEYFGTRVDDPYRWLEDDRSEKTAQWVAAENKVTNEYISKIPLRGKLLSRLKKVADYQKVYAPWKKHGRYYFLKNDGLQNQAVLYVADKLGGEAKVFIDPNKLSDEGTVALTSLEFSHDGKYVGYTISRNGSDWSEIYVMDAKTGQLLDDHIEWAKFTYVTWMGDGFFYSAYDTPKAGGELSGVNEVHKVYYHKIGTKQSEDKLFYQNPAYPKRFYGVSVNKEETLMFLTESGHGSGNTLFVRDLRVPDSQFIQMTADPEDFCSVVRTDGDDIILYTNVGAPNGRLMKASVKNPGAKDWQVLVPEQEAVLSGVDLCGDKLILTYNKDASDHAYIYTPEGKMVSEVKLPGIGSVSFSCSREYNDCFYTFTSFTTPGTIYSLDTDKNTATLYSQPKVGFDTKNLVSEQLFFESKDGTRVPMFITYKKGMKLDGKNPVLLYGYGGFNISLTPGFSAMRIPFIESGGIYAQVNLRGGNEYGEKWHQAGTKMNKQNVFDDFISAAEYLISQKYTNKDKIAIQGGSNGGLLVGACMTQRPDLFKVCVPQVGVMDMLRYHKFTIGWNWAGDYGKSDDSPEMFRYLLGYSPLHNLKPGTAYPATLITTADHDDRVVPAHSFKFAARLQECQGGTAPVLIRIDTNAGHGSGKPMEKVLEEQADIYSFIMQNLGMKVK